MSCRYLKIKVMQFYIVRVFAWDWYRVYILCMASKCGFPDARELGRGWEVGLLSVEKSAENATSPCLQYKTLCCIKRDVWNNGGTTFLARPKLERECTESRAVIMFLQNKVFISFQLNHRSVQKKRDNSMKQ